MIFDLKIRIRLDSTIKLTSGFYQAWAMGRQIPRKVDVDFQNDCKKAVTENACGLQSTICNDKITAFDNNCGNHLYTVYNKNVTDNI